MFGQVQGFLMPLPTLYQQDLQKELSHLWTNKCLKSSPLNAKVIVIGMVWQFGMAIGFQFLPKVTLKKAAEHKEEKQKIICSIF